jgi:Lon protease-like protein
MPAMMPTGAPPAASLPIFPLGSVLLPGAELSLRIFERRYLDLVRTCCREDSGFGVCAILDGNAVGARALPAALGTEARIVDFTSLPDGLLGIRVRGGRRFHIRRTQVRDSGLIVAAIDWLPASASSPLAIEHELLATLLRRLLERSGGTHAKAAQEHYRDAEWVSWRLAELLPLTLTQRQALLQENDPQQRTQRLLELVATLLPE